MENTVNQRLNLIVETFENGNKSRFARAASISTTAVQGMLDARQSAPSFEALTKILEAYSQVSTDWLLFGKGEMLKNTLPARPAHISADDRSKDLVAQAENVLLRQQLADKDKLIERLWQLIPAKLGKLMSRLEAAGVFGGADQLVGSLSPS